MSAVILPAKKAIWPAFVFTPWLTPLVFFPLAYAWVVLFGENRPGLSWYGFLVFSYGFGVPLGYLAIAVLGWPWLKFLRRINHVSIVTVCAGSTLIGMAAFLIFVAIIGTHPDYLAVAGIGATCGLLSGLIFSVIAGIGWR